MAFISTKKPQKIEFVVKKNGGKKRKAMASQGIKREAFSDSCKDRKPSVAESGPEKFLLPPFPKGPYALGYRVQVYWAGDKMYYAGKLTKYDAMSDTHTVRYDEDGNKEEIDLEEANIIFLAKTPEEKDELHWQRYYARLHSKRIPFQRPRNAFQLYCSKFSEEFKRKYADSSSRELQKIYGQQWKQVSPGTRIPLENEAKAGMAAYSKKMEDYLQAMPRGGYPPLQPKEIPLKSWQIEKIKQASPRWKAPTTELFERGFTVFENVLSQAVIKLLLEGRESKEGSEHNAANSMEQENTLNGRRILRKRSARQTWQGAKATIAAHVVRRPGGQLTIKAPLCMRSNGRYDMPLSNDIAAPVMDALRKRGLVDFVQGLLNNRGKIRTQNIMLSESGSLRQPIHTDSSWADHSKRDPKPHYFTILVPFVDQTRATGGTMLYPGTHRFAQLAAVENGGSIKGIELPLKAGNALVFDGLLQHQGTENVSGECGNGEPVDRYFYYAAISIGKDPNTWVTGYGGKRQKCP